MPDEVPTNGNGHRNGGGTAVKLSRKDLQTDQEVRWCPGCGDYSILAAMPVSYTHLTLPTNREV